MASPKEILLGKKKLRDWWLSVNKKTEFLEVLAFAKSELMSTHALNQEQIRGALSLENVLLTITDEDDKADEFAGPQLHHDVTSTSTQT